ncbi:hypothetical protein V490_00711 [Pseudogymnoascus sp. VKM F-3557]|nr:hypothetical protein V490_00711 [Pseudogymnoascus sp. VKM F-3557]
MGRPCGIINRISLPQILPARNYESPARFTFPDSHRVNPKLRRAVLALYQARASSADILDPAVGAAVAFFKAWPYLDLFPVDFVEHARLNLAVLQEYDSPANGSNVRANYGDPVREQAVVTTMGNVDQPLAIDERAVSNSHRRIDLSITCASNFIVI